MTRVSRLFAPAALLLPSAAMADVPLHPSIAPEAAVSVHAEHMQRPPMRGPQKALPSMVGKTSINAAGPDRTVYGYWPYWGDDLSTVPMDSLSHLAVFAVSLNADGTLGNQKYWTGNAPKALSLAEPYGVRVHMTVTCFTADIMTAVLGNTTTRNTAIQNIANLVNTYGGHGVNIDFEGLPSAQKATFVTFIKDLNAQVGDVFLATPAVDWSGAFDYDELANNSDGLFIMGYGYHWSSGDPGPVGPLYGGSPWSSYSLDWSVDDYIKYGTPRAKIILGLPLYGYDWPSTNTTVPGDATGTGTSVTYSYAVPQGIAYGRKWDSVTHTPYAFPDSVSQMWYDDNESLEDKIQYAVDENLQGVGFWALTYEDNNAAFWSMVDSLTTDNSCPDADGDGYTTCDGDCNDASTAFSPGATEACDGEDNNCNGWIDDTADADGDLYNTCSDCDDSDPNTNPTAEEVPRDGVDNDCDGEVDEDDGSGCTVPTTPTRNKALPMGLLALFGLTARRIRRR